MLSRSGIRIVTGCILIGVLVVPPVFGQDSGSNEDLLLPRNNVRGGSVGSRRPGLWITGEDGGLTRALQFQNQAVRNYGGVVYTATQPANPWREFRLEAIQIVFDTLQDILLSLIGIQPPPPPNGDDPNGNGDPNGEVECPDVPPGTAVYNNGCPMEMVAEDYLELVNPRGLAFDPDGILYVGQDCLSCTPYRVDITVDTPQAAPYGAVVVVGPAPVALDEDGIITGNPGALITAGLDASDFIGYYYQILPETPNPVFALLYEETDPAQLFGYADPADMAFDPENRLLFIDEATQHVFRFEGGLTLIRDLLYAIELTGDPAAWPTESGNIAVDDIGLIYTYARDGVMRVHDSDGLLLDDDFHGDCGVWAPMAFGPGGQWGTDLYVICDGRLLRFTDEGPLTVADLFFEDTPVDMAFGPDLALYVSVDGDLSDFTVPDRIVRVTLAD